MVETKSVLAGERTQADIRQATHGFNVYIHPALVQIHVNDEDEQYGERLSRLIAAAHGLLETLEQIANLWPRKTTAKISDVNGINDGKQRAILLESAVELARAAIAKAGQ